ncbi:MAG TPA: hypothetical protein VIY73_03775 [Polyangiaceae bacterium]
MRAHHEAAPGRRSEPAPGGQAPVLFCVATLLALAGHAKVAVWTAGALGFPPRGCTRDTYRDATRLLLASLVVMAGAAFVLRSAGAFLAVMAPTAIVGISLLRRHSQAALAMLAEGEP